MMFAYHDSHSLDYRSPFGAAPVGSQVRLRLDVDDPIPGLKCFLRFWQDGQGARLVPMDCDSWGSRAQFSATVTMPDAGCLLWYSFILENYESRWFYGNNLAALGGEGQLYESNPKAYQITVYVPNETPRWYKTGIAYQIFPDRFFRGEDWLRRQADAIKPDGWKGPKHLLQLDWNDTPHYLRNDKGEIARWTSFGGTLAGIREKLLYLKSLGVTVLYLNPIFAGSSNHKYDTADYLRVDPALGDDESFQALVDEARDLGIRILLDGVFSHTGADSRYFDRLGNYGTHGAAQDPDSPYAAWYRFRHWPDDYECWWGVTDLPNVNELEPSYAAFIHGDQDSVIRHWLKTGIGGWRLDVADELPDAFIAGIRRAMDETAPDSVLLGEVWEDASNKVSYGEQRRYFLGEELHSVMNYPFREMTLSFFLGKITADQLRARLLSQMENYPPENFYGNLNLIGSHDRERILTLLGEAPDQDTMTEREREDYRLTPEQYALAKRRLKMLSLLQFTMPGVPCIYYGDEAGAQGFRDPFNRGTYPWGREDQELLFHYRAITTLRQQHPVLATGTYVPQAFGDHVYGCLRRDEHETIQVLVNRGIFETETVTVPMADTCALELLMARWLEPQDGSLTVELPPLTAVVVQFLRSKPAAAPRTRAAGVICPLAAIPSQSDSPTLTDGKAFVDFLTKAGQKLWQLLPVNPTGLGGSPYYSPAVFAGDPRFIDRSREPDWTQYDAFCQENRAWLDDYALYTALKAANGGAAWTDWPDDQRDRIDVPALLAAHRDAVEALRRDQFWFWSQWAELKQYANDHGILLIGDVPLGVADDSADVWAAPQWFQLDSQGHPKTTAGVPPDYYSPDGQNWGNPVYDWDALAADGYSWWIERLRQALRAYDFVRLDHFRGFSEYFSIPAGKTGAWGGWRPGPGLAFFQAAEKALGGPLPILAEDLGSLDAGVYDLLRRTGFPGMDVYQFEKAKMDAAAPEDAARRTYYASTHDSQTLLGWCRDTWPEEDPGQQADAVLETLYASDAPWVLTQLQDLLGLDDAARYNTPGTVGPQNWSWRADGAQLTAEVAARFADLARRHGRA
jgi:4-alpha-glucanotransferase